MSNKERMKEILNDNLKLQATDSHQLRHRETGKELHYEIIPEIADQIDALYGDWEAIAKKLYDLLDDIDTLPDMLKPSTLEDYKKLQSLIQKRAENRHELLKTDGYKVWKPIELPK